VEMSIHLQRDSEILFSLLIFFCFKLKSLSLDSETNGGDLGKICVESTEMVPSQARTMRGAIT